MPDPTNDSPDRLAATFTAAGLRAAVRAGTRRTAVAQIASHVVSLLVLATLLRLVGPGSFGLVTMVMSVLLLLRIVTSLGLNVATIQQRDLSPGQVSTLFWLHVVLGVATAIVTAALAPAVAWFYRQDLIGLTVGLAGTSIVVALGLQHVALLERDLRLGRAAWARVGGQVIGGAAAVAAALLGAGVWSLVVQQYVEFTALAVLAWCLEPWRPRAPWAGEPAGHLIHFGGRVAASSVLMYLLANFDKVLIGFALHDERALGLYSQAYSIMMKPVFVLTTPLISIMLPALSRAAHDQESFRRLVLALLRLVALASFPTGIGLMLTAREGMLVLGGEEWSEAGVLLASLAATILAQGFIVLTGTVYMARGLSRALLIAVTAMTVVLVAGVLVGFSVGSMYGRPTLGVALGYSLTTCIVIFIPYVAACLRCVGVPVRQWIEQLWPSALAAFGMGAIVWLCRLGLVRITGLPPIGLLAAEIAIGVLAYLLLARGEVRWCLGQLRGVTRTG